MMRPVLAVAALSLAACSMSGGGGDDDGRPGVPAQGTGGTRTFQVSGFTGIDLRGADDVDVSVGPGFSVRADGKPDVLDQLKIERIGDTLRIARLKGHGWEWNAHGAKIAVTLPSLTQVAVAGSGNVTVDRVSGPRFAGDGAGSGDVKLAGTARHLTVSIAGSGDVEARGLTAAGADVSVAGSGGVRATVNGPAKVSVMGSGDVDLGPGARCQTSKMGSGSVRCGS